MQGKLFRDAFQKAGLDINKDLVSIDARDKTVDEALEVVKDTLRKIGKDV